MVEVGRGVPPPGTLLGDKYRVGNVIGSGGMGVVVAGEHVALGQRVAIKLLNPEIAHRDEIVRRLLREARATVNMRGEHVCRVLDVGTLPDGLPYLVMERLDGEDLGTRLAKCGCLPLEEAVDYLLQALEAVAEAHARGILHRDLKPSNLFLTERADGSALVKVLDFGIAKPLDKAREERTLTADGSPLGSPHYMSPEQIRGDKTLDTRSDIWSLGVVLYRLVTGVFPFDADSVAGLAAKIATDPPRPIAETITGDSKELDGVIAACLQKDPAERPQSVAELARRLSRFASERAQIHVERTERVERRSFGETSDETGAGDPVTASMSGGGGPTLVAEMETAPAVDVHSRPGHAERPRGTRRPGLAVAAVVGVLAVAVAYPLWRTRQNPSEKTLDAARPVPAPSASADPVTSRGAESPAVMPITEASDAAVAAPASVRRVPGRFQFHAAATGETKVPRPDPFQDRK